MTRDSLPDIVIQRPEIGLVDVDVGMLRPRLGLIQPNGADLGLREHRRRNVGVIDPRRPVAEHSIGERMALADGDGGQIDAVRDIAHRVDVRHICPREAIDRDTTVHRVQRNTSLLKA